MRTRLNNMYFCSCWCNSYVSENVEHFAAQISRVEALGQSRSKSRGAYHLARKSGNFGLKSNGKIISRKFRSETVEYLQRYSSGVFHLQKISEISIGNSGNFRLGRERSICHKSHSFTSSSPSLHQKKTNALVNCSAIFSNASLFVAFSSNKCLLSACVVMRSLTSVCSRRSRFTVAETSLVS